MRRTKRLEANAYHEAGHVVMCWSEEPSISSDIPTPLAGLLSSLPPQGQGWTQGQRDKFLSTFGAVLDFCFSIVEHKAPEQGQDEEDTDQ